MRNGPKLSSPPLAVLYETKTPIFSSGMSARSVWNQRVSPPCPMMRSPWLDCS